MSKKFSWPKGYQYVMDESWKLETYIGKEKDKIYYTQIPCACGGFVCLYSLNPVIFKFWTPSRRKVCRELSEEYDLEMDDRMDGYEAILYFPLKLFNEVCKEIKARKRRKKILTEDQKTEIGERLKKGKQTKLDL